MRYLFPFFGQIAAALAMSANMEAPILLTSAQVDRSCSSVRKRARRVQMIAGGYRPKRSKGKSARRGGKSNRLHVGARVRRRHRRLRKAA